MLLMQEFDKKVTKIPEISFVIPVSNAAYYLRCCLASVLQQSFANFELICVDDHSTDNFYRIFPKYVLNDSRIRILHKVTNHGEA